VKKLNIRLAKPQDAAVIAGLLSELGYPNVSAFVRDKLAVLGTSDTVLVAEDEGEVLGFAHLHVSELFHAPGRIGRIMALAVTASHRRAGAGRGLMIFLERLARQAGCVKLEVTSSIQRKGAHAFYEQMGYQEEPRRFVKMLAAEDRKKLKI
jgi:GNAT superfamily N-acetyltransferase